MSNGKLRNSQAWDAKKVRPKSEVFGQAKKDGTTVHVGEFDGPLPLVESPTFKTLPEIQGARDNFKDEEGYRAVFDGPR